MPKREEWLPLPVCPRCNVTGRRASDGVSLICPSCLDWVVPPKDDPPTKPSRIGSCVDETSPLAESVAAPKLTIRDRVYQTPWTGRLAFPISFGSIDRFIWEREQKAKSVSQSRLWLWEELGLPPRKPT